MAGSRNVNGNVPNVNSNPDNQTVNVNWNSPDNADPHLCARSEVSIKLFGAQGSFKKTPFVLEMSMENQNHKQMGGGAYK
jgi:hypothetical protein